jgi:gamma-glutamyltranspeptidase/glutathione hydrolase
VETSEAARLLLEAGGNAYDAALGAMCAACVCEPMLASLGGGGYLLARTAGGGERVYDFFVQVPSAGEGDLDFYPIQADFGTATQEFHIGMGSIAVPGVVAGLFAVHRSLGSLPLEEIVAPAAALARRGVQLNPLQKYINEILQPIIEVSPEIVAMASPVDASNRLADVGDTIANPALADMLERLARHGERWFYEGEPARQLVQDCQRHGGLISAKDLGAYRVIERKPIVVDAFGARISLNSPPSPGGCLVAFALRLLEEQRPGRLAWGDAGYAMALARVMQAGSLVRRQFGLSSGLDDTVAADILAPESLAGCRETLAGGGLASRGTTHISIVDGSGNVAALSLSNGEGSAYVLPGSGIILNNMLGEEDLNPAGFHTMPPGARLASMMTPAIAELHDGGVMALGSGGSNRIRSAMLQVLANALAFGMDLEDAVNAPRMHLEHDHLSIESGFTAGALEALEESWPGVERWPEGNLFFGGVHAVRRNGDGSMGAVGDARRGGSVAFAELRGAAPG